MSATVITILGPKAKVLGNVRPLADHARSVGQRQTADIGTSLQDQVDELYKILKAFTFTIPPTPIPTVGASVTVIDESLVAGVITTITPPDPVAVGAALCVFVQAQGETASIAWDLSTKWAPTEFDSTLDTWTVFNFVARLDPIDAALKWFYVGPEPVTGKI